MTNQENESVSIEFYDVKTRQKVSVDEANIKKVTYHPQGSGGKPRYAVRGEYEGRNLTKFVSKDAYDALNLPEAE
jgi:Holliday junction resolvase